MNKVFGIVLIAFGLIGVIWGGIQYTSEKRILDVGPIHATKTEHHTMPLPPVAGAILLVGGVVVLAANRH